MSRCAQVGRNLRCIASSLGVQGLAGVLTTKSDEVAQGWGLRFSGPCATVVESLAALLEVRMHPAGNLSVCGLQVLLSCMQALMEQFKFGQRADFGR
jgi:hypothetical protein